MIDTAKERKMIQKKDKRAEKKKKRERERKNRVSLTYARLYIVVSSLLFSSVCRAMISCRTRVKRWRKERCVCIDVFFAFDSCGKKRRRRRRKKIEETIHHYTTEESLREIFFGRNGFNQNFELV